MSAGSVRAPLVIPLRLPTEGQPRNAIDNATLIELSSDTPSARIYFTIDGSRPDPIAWKPRQPQPGPTYLFREPFTLPPGTKMIKAVAVHPSTNQESNVVTKTFEVLSVPEQHHIDKTDTGPGQDDYDFIKELKTERALVRQASSGITPRSSSSARQRKPTNNGSRPTGLKHPIPKQRGKGESEEKETLAAPYKPVSNRGEQESDEKWKKANHRLSWKSSASDSSDDKSRGSVVTPPQVKKNLGQASRRMEREERKAPRISPPRFDRIQREVDLFNCPTCLSARPADPAATFCPCCGATLPRLPISTVAAPPKLEELDTCFTCGSKLAVDEKKCLICEAPSTHANKNAESEALDRRLCSTCGSLNPVYVKSCLTCESALPQTAASLVNISALLRNSGKSSVPQENTDSPASRPVAKCRICYRQNSLGARFCDWCGIQNPHDDDCPEPLQKGIVCPQCFWQTLNDAHFCPICGFNLDEPSKASSMFKGTHGHSACSSKAQSIVEASSMESLTPRTNRNVGTQTVGLFFPSANHMKAAAGCNQSHNSAETPPKTRRPIVAPISPGRGMWRMQLEHVVAHLRAYIRNNVEFQKAIGDPRMGRILCAGVEEDRDDVTICVTFKRHYLNPMALSQEIQEFSRQEEIGATTEEEDGQVVANTSRPRRPVSSFNSSNAASQPHRKPTPLSANFRKKLRGENIDNSGTQQPRFRTAVNREPLRAFSPNSSFNKSAPLENQTSGSLRLNKLLIEELRTGHKADVDVVASLIFEGANPSCLAPSGDPLIVKAVQSQQLESIPLLVRAGADVNAIGTRDGNTPLHEAVLLESQSEQFVRTLLEYVHIIQLGTMLHECMADR
uniref:ANK_REP_REGION domain-containing protein n=2 Tax=Mesocestoides corti TaxID=53468 RepID=A0A5K3ELE0_MESCO